MNKTDKKQSTAQQNKKSKRNSLFANLTDEELDVLEILAKKALIKEEVTLNDTRTTAES